MSQLRFQISAVPGEEAAYQARPMIDGADVLAALPDEPLGLDPSTLRHVLADDAEGTTLIGRCNCTVLGCADVYVEITHAPGNRVIWSLDGRDHTFDAGQYAASLAEFRDDHSWEPLGRRVERLIEEYIATQGDAPPIDWVSTRIEPRRVTNSFVTPRGQVLLSLPWDGETEDSALAAHADGFAGLCQSLRQRDP